MAEGPPPTATARSTSRTRGTDYAYNANGSLTASTGGPTLAYDDKDQMTAVTPNGAGQVDYAYRGATRQDLMGFGDLELTPSVLGASAQRDTDPLTNPLGLTTSYFVRDSSGSLLGQRVDDGVPLTVDDRYFYLTDGLGSIISVTDDTGAEVNTYTYDPYGQPLTTNETVDNPWRYAGGYHHPGLDAHKYGVRYMQPAAGRWTQVDPVETEHPYLYAGGDPVDNIDPSGTEFLGISWDDVSSFGECAFSVVQVAGSMSMIQGGLFVTAAGAAGTSFGVIPAAGVALIGVSMTAGGMVSLAQGANDARDQCEEAF